MATKTHRGGKRARGPFGQARTGIVRFTLLFGSLIAGLSLIVAPLADRRSRQYVAERDDGIDDVITGSIARADPLTGGARRYTVQRSILADPGAGPCLLFPDGSQRGSC